MHVTSSFVLISNKVSAKTVPCIYFVCCRKLRWIRIQWSNS